MKKLLLVLMLMFSGIGWSQEITGTYTIYVESIKDVNMDIEINENIRINIKKHRRDVEDFLLKIDGFNIMIMSRKKMEADLKWAKYSIKEK